MGLHLFISVRTEHYVHSNALLLGVSADLCRWFDSGVLTASFDLPCL